MNKKGFSLHWIHMYYLLLLMIILIALAGRIHAAGDDTSYNLEFYARDVAYGVEAFLWSDGEGEYVYPLKEGYEISVDNSLGKITAKKGISKETYTFRTRTGYEINAKPTAQEGVINPYVISKKEKKADTLG